MNEAVKGVFTDHDSEALSLVANQEYRLSWQQGRACLVADPKQSTVARRAYNVSVPTESFACASVQLFLLSN